MRYLKTLGIAAFMVVAVTAFAGAGTASADEICTKLENPCLKNRVTELHETLKAGSSAIIEDTNGNALATCTSATRLTEVSKQGVGVKPITFKEVSTVFGAAGTACTFPIKAIKNGTGTDTENGTGNTTETSVESEITVNTGLFGSCVYSTGTGTDMGTDAGGSNTVEVNAVLTKVSGLCPNSTRLKATLVITNHNAIIFIAN